MSVIRVNKNRDYFYASNEPFNDKRLSWEARGVMGYLLSKPDGWECRNFDIVNQSDAGDYVIKRIMKELQEYGYLHRYRTSEGRGDIKWVTEIYESPSLNEYFTKAQSFDHRKSRPSKESTVEKPHDIVSTDSSKDLPQKKLIGPTPQISQQPQPSPPIDSEASWLLHNRNGHNQTEVNAITQIETYWRKRISQDTKQALTLYHAAMLAAGQDSEIPKDRSTQGKWAAGAADHLDNYTLEELKTLYPLAIKHAKDREWDIYSPQSLTTALAKVKAQNDKVKPAVSYKDDPQYLAFAEVFDAE